jgi:hypothetical protein
MKFLTRLIELADSFRLEGAIKINTEIHQAERNGYILSKEESKYLVELLRNLQFCSWNSANEE